VTTEPLHTLRWSTWLGWQIESNWANPWLFALYLVIKPITSSLMLVAMFYAANAAVSANPSTARGIPSELLPFVYISNACFGFVGCVMFGMSNVVTSDRDGYRMLKYIFVSPARFQAYFLGRGLARALEGIAGGAITILAGCILPGIRNGIGDVDIPWMLAFLLVGFIGLWAAGMILASIVLNLSRSASFLSEGIAGVVYFLSGVLFPLTILPTPLRIFGECLPTTYWIEGMRRTMIGPPKVITMADGTLIAPMFETWTNWDLMFMLLGTTVGLVIVAQFVYHASVRRAWHRGKIEETQGM
jgi:ABC-2 type transport system permease protein